MWATWTTTSTICGLWTSGGFDMHYRTEADLSFLIALRSDSPSDQLYAWDCAGLHRRFFWRSVKRKAWAISSLRMAFQDLKAASTVATLATTSVRAQAVE